MTDNTIRDAQLRQMLTDRRDQLQEDVQRRLRDGRTDRQAEVCDEVEHSDLDSQGEIELALLQMRADTLARIEQALMRLDAGEYGACVSCEREIAAPRLKALPFAVRCKACEERREQGQGQEQRAAHQRAGASLFPEVARS